MAAAYDTIASDYDHLVAEDQWMRTVLWRHYRSAFRPGSRILEVGCGTGLDTFVLAEAGSRVVAVDVSPAMIERLRVKRLRAKRHSGPAADRIEPRVLDGGTLASLPSAGFDGIVSAFAGVNTIADWSEFSKQAARLLRPGGRLLLHLLAPAGLWERWKALGEHGWPTAKTLHHRRQRTLEIGGRSVRHQVLPARDAARLFEVGFRCRRLYGLGFLWPRDRSQHIPLAIAQSAARLEARLGAFSPFLDWGRFYVLDLERRQ
ncbi:MAG: methyltransferase domain-containing protein [Acidobacteriota bacterium]